jgi:hypothetical protein
VICAKEDSIIFPPQYPTSAYTLTEICCNCCDNPPPIIDGETEINIFFDSSGSMSSTEGPLNIMAKKILKTCLLPFYGDDGDLYDERVRVRNFSDERGYKVLGTSGSTSEITKVINLVFQDEADPVYTPRTSGDTDSSRTWNNEKPRTESFNEDISELRSILDSNSIDVRGEYFQVTNTVGPWGPNFKILLQSVETGLGQYVGDYSLWDKSKIHNTYDVIAGDSANYYTNLVIGAINSLGYNIPICEEEPDWSNIRTEFIFIPNLNPPT